MDSKGRHITELTVPIKLKRTSSPFDFDVLRNATKIDRTTCERIVPMEVLVLGLSRTGTASVRHALFELGYFDVYHGASYCNENPRDCDMWAEAFKMKLEGKRVDRKYWDRLLGHCMAVTDTPCDVFADDLIDAYPEAKVILTIRDSAEIWKRSMENTVVRSAISFADNDHSVLGKLFALFLPRSPYQPFFSLNTKHNRLLDIPRDGLDMYEAHTNRIRKLVDNEKLLEFNVKQGWKPLCNFLSKNIPDVSFPRVNSEENYIKIVGEFEKRMALQATRNMMTFLAIVVALLCVCIAKVW